MLSITADTRQEALREAATGCAGSRSSASTGSTAACNRKQSAIRKHEVCSLASVVQVEVGAASNHYCGSSRAPWYLLRHVLLLLAGVACCGRAL